MHVRACWLVALLFVGSLPAAAPPPRHPLPEGARLRLGTMRWRFGSGLRVQRPIVLSTDRKLLAYEDDRLGIIRVFDSRTGRQRYRLAKEDTRVYALAFAHNGQVLAAVEEDAGVLFWDLGKERPPRRLNNERMFAETFSARAAFLPGNKQLATWDGDRLAVWDVATGRRQRQWRCRTTDDLASFSPDGRQFAHWPRAGALMLLDLVGGGWRRVPMPVNPDVDDPGA